MKAKPRSKAPRKLKEELEPERGPGSPEDDEDEETPSTDHVELADEDVREVAEAALEQTVTVSCPYCDDEFDVHASSDDDGQTQLERCRSCSRNVSVTISVENGEIEVEPVRS
jgi:hypothetical protein